MKLNAVFLDQWLNKIPKEARFFLVYGPEEGLIRLTVQKLQKKLLGAGADDFNLVHLEMKQIKEDFTIIADELRSISLLGGQRLIIVQGITNSSSKGFVDLFRQAPGNAFCILVGDDLKPASTMRKLFEEQGHTIAIACYKDDASQMSKFIRDEFSRLALSYDSDVPALLTEMMPPNRLLVTQELEKLSLYCGGQKITQQQVADCLIDVSELKLDELCHAFVRNDLKNISSIINSIDEEESNFVMVIRVIARYIMRLIEVQSYMSEGLNAEQAVSKLSPPVFFKQKNNIITAAKNVSYEYLQNTLKQLTNLEVQCKSGLFEPNLLLRKYLISPKRGI